MCDKSFKQKGDLTTHTESVHQAGQTNIVVCSSIYDDDCENKTESKQNSLGKCLMCVHYFDKTELEKHLWGCKAKLPCLSRVVEIKMESKEDQSHNDNGEIRTEIPRPQDCNGELKTQSLSKQNDHSAFKKEFQPVQNINSGLEINISSNYFSCTLCRKIFSSKHALSKHTSNHKREKRSRCSLCEKAFYTNKDVIRHINAVHKNLRPFSCTVCSVSFTEKSKLNKHVKTQRHKMAEICTDSYSVSPQEIKTGFQSLQNYMFESKHSTHSPSLDDNKAETPPLQGDDNGKSNVTQNIRSEASAKQKPFSCSLCNQSFLRKYSVIKHINSVHKKLKPHSCPLCNKSFTQKYQRDFHLRCVQHQNKSKSEKPPSCHLCGKQFYKRFNLKQHVNSVHKKLRPFLCTFCGQSFSLKRNRNHHVSHVHEATGEVHFNMDNVINIVPLPAQNSSQPDGDREIKELVSQQDDNVEIKTESASQKEKNYEFGRVNLNHKVDSLSCTLCIKSFTSKHDLLRHDKTVHKELKEYSCSICNKQFAAKANLTGHMNAVHHKLKPFSCTLCDRSFSFKNVLTRHFKVVHDKLKPFSCTLCNNSFATKRDLSIHNRYHTGEKPYSCSQCEKHFYTKHHLVQHSASKHKVLL